MSNGDLNSEALERTSTVGKPIWNFFTTKQGISNDCESTYVGDAVAACRDEDGVEVVDKALLGRR